MSIRFLKGLKCGRVLSIPEFFCESKECLIIKEEEKELKSAIAKWCSISAEFDIRGKQIIIYGCETENEGYSVLLALLPEFAIPDFATFLDANAIYTLLLRFTLTDSSQRIFSAERWCFSSSMDD